MSMRLSLVAFAATVLASACGPTEPTWHDTYREMTGSSRDDDGVEWKMQNFCTELAAVGALPGSPADRAAFAAQRFPAQHIGVLDAVAPEVCPAEYQSFRTNVGTSVAVAVRGG